MVRDLEKSGASRRALLAVLMLAVLGASVGAAWLLERRAAGRVRAGAGILQEIRAKGLGHFWPEKMRTDWYIVKHGTRLVGWRAIVRGRTGSDKFVGLRVDADSTKHRYRREIWTLNADASTCEYDTLQGILRWPPVVEKLESGIRLANGRIRLIRHDLSVATGSPAPADYPPQGLLEPVLQIVAAKKADAQFRVVPGDVPDFRSDPHVRFVTTRIRYVGTDKTADGKPVNRVEKTIMGGGESLTWTYELNEGRIVSIASGDERQWVAVNEQTVTKTFKDAPQYLRHFLLHALHHFWK